MINDFGVSWSPANLTVTVGTTVTWAWVGFHDVTSDVVAEPYSSGGPMNNGSLAHTFNTVGTFGYYCTLHGSSGGGGMYGRIYVIGLPTLTSTRTPSFTVTPTFTPVPPTLSSLSAAPAPGVASTLTASGSGFQAGAQVLLDGFALPTTFGSSSSLMASLPALAAGSYNVTVRNADGSVSAVKVLIIVAGPVPTFTPTHTPGPAVGPTAGSGNGPLIVETHPFPNPNPRAISVLLTQDVDGLEVKVYTTGMQVIGIARHAAALAGWVQVSLPDGLQSGDASGLYYYVVTAQRNGNQAKAPKSGKLIIIR